MAIEQGLSQLITANSDIKTLVGTDKSGTTSLYWILAPQGATLPFLVLSRVATGDTYAAAGITGLRDGLFQITCYASSYYPSRSVATAVRQFLDDYKGTLPDGTVVDAVFTEKDWDMSYQEGGKGFVYGGCLQFRVWYYDR